MPLATECHDPRPGVRSYVESGLEVVPDVGGVDGDRTGARVLPGDLNGIGPLDTGTRALERLHPEQCDHHHDDK